MKKDVSCVPNSNEVKSYRYVNQQELKELLEQGQRGQLKVTPWFQIICDKFLFKWWNSLDDLSSFMDADAIHRMI